jgi:inositol 2-dehydrogenase
MTKTGLGVIGLGRMGTVYGDHVAAQMRDAQLVAVSDTRDEVLTAYTERMAGVKAYRDYHDLLADPAIHGVIVVTPTSTHREVVIAAAQAGKAIFCEKPTALTLEATDAMIAAVEQAGVMFQVGFMRRFDRGYAEAKRRIEAGIIGQPVTVRSISRDPFRTSLEYASPQVSGGIIIDMAIHDFDIVRWMMDDDIARVYTEAHALVYPELLDVGDVDNAMIVCKFTRGGVGNIEASRTARYGYDIQCTIVGSEGTLQVGYLQETPVLTLTRDGVLHDVVPHFPQRFGAAYTAQIEHFAACLRDGKPPRVSIADARAALQAAIAATRSQHEARPIAVADVG